MADQYPSATVIGTDLSPIQPEWVPPNCHFEIDDVSLDWTFPSNHFDFIHIRELFGCIPDWDFFLTLRDHGRGAVRRPGGEDAHILVEPMQPLPRAPRQRRA